jgi:hypothetical protein
MENRYHNGRIYKIVCGDLTYIGSTCQPLSKRLAEHRSNFKGWKNGKRNNVSSFRLFEIGEPTIVLIEAIKCENKEELFRRERYYIETIDCVNMCIPGRTMKEWSIDNADKLNEKKKEYYNSNLDTFKKRNAEYYMQNAEMFKEKGKEYYNTNLDTFKKRNAESYMRNADKIKEKRKEYYLQNADKIKENRRESYLQNADKIKEKRKESYLSAHI